MSTARSRALLTLHAAVLAAWTGAAVLTAARVAPAAFEALPTRAEAGSFVGGILRAVYLTGIAAGLVAAGVAVVRGARLRIARVTVAALVLTANAASLVIAARIATMREALGPIDALPPDDPGRRAFGALHGVSMLVMLAGVLAALAAIVLEPLAQADSRSSSSGSG